MKRIALHYQFTPEREAVARVHNPVMQTLDAIREHGSISAGARAIGYSFRHVWNQIKAWEAMFGHPLTVSDGGQGATLSPFALKLLWAEKRAQARLAPQIAALQAELEHSMAQAFEAPHHELSLCASHDDALPLLQEHAATTAGLYMDIRYGSSTDALRALNEGRCQVAGFHVSADAALRARAARAFKPLLRPGEHKLLGFASRWQGLMLPRGNPMRIHSLMDVVRHGARWVHRAPGTGTRLLLEDLLEEAGLAPTSLPGHGRAEPSHAAVAQAVASGQADAGLGVVSAARRAGLDFVPLAQEHYHLVCLRSAVESPALLALRHQLLSPDWQTRLVDVPGYLPHRSGEVQSLKTALPWWPARSRKPVSA